MKNFDFKDRDGGTSLTEEQLKGLKHDIYSQGELDELEEENITIGLAWLSNSNECYLKYDFWKKTHKKLFENVWAWAGEVRENQLQNPYFSEPGKISQDLYELEKNLKTWNEYQSFSAEMLLVHFHLEIITIHPFPNGNGRVSRILTEHIASKTDVAIPTWGSDLKSQPDLRRQKYIEALDSARQTKDFEKLKAFMWP